MSDDDRDVVRQLAEEDPRGPAWAEAAARGPLVPAEAEVPDATAADEEPAAPGVLGRYLRYQARDWVRQRGVWMFVALWAFVVVAWLSYHPAVAERMYSETVAQRAAYAARAAKAGQPFAAWHVPTPAERLRDAFLGWTLALSTLGSVAATFGVVARDRERGFQRFLFAKPVPVVPYYVQKLAVAFAGYMLIALAGSLLASLLFATAFPIGVALGVAAAAFATLGALTFFFSTLTRFDGGATFAALGLAIVALVAATPPEGVDLWWNVAARAARWVLPPVPVADVLSRYPEQWTMGVPLAVVWILAYAAAAFVAALAVLRRRSITT